VTSPFPDGKLFPRSGKHGKNRDEFREPFTGTALVMKQERTVVAHSIRIACTALVVAFTVGLGAAAAGDIVADHPAVHGAVNVTVAGFDWDSAPAGPPAQI
jgi:hypothetical protein